MFEKQLYGCTSAGDNQQAYGNWILSCYYQNQLKGVVSKPMPYK